MKSVLPLSDMEQSPVKSFLRQLSSDRQPLRAKKASNAALASADFRRCLKITVSSIDPPDDLGGRAADEPPRLGEGLGRKRRDIVGRFERRLLDLRGRQHKVDEAQRLPGCGVERLPHDQKFERAMKPDQPRHQQARSGFRYETEVDKWRREARIARRHHVVAVQQHRGADADRDTLNRGDQRLGAVGETVQEAHGLWPQALHMLGCVQEILEVGAGGATRHARR